ncbi:signal peptidase I [Kineosporia rhizophila]|uniref:signal peptidase I n=1 Tax=Kineosporia rhizophila TaxID=84633 RepID=UPI001E32D879|nr:signal peptidase I [Kineosporia rhizophila]
MAGRVAAGIVLGLVLGFAAVLVGLGSGLPRLTDWQSYTVVSGSMEPAVRSGDVVVIKNDGRRWVPIGTVVTYRQPGTGVLVTHRVVGVDPVRREYTTQGDANPAADPVPVPAEAVVGSVRMVVPLGRLPLPGAGVVLCLAAVGVGVGLGVAGGRRARRGLLAGTLVSGALVAGVLVPTSATSAQFTATSSTTFSIATTDRSAFADRTQALGPVAYWPLDESSGPTAADVAGTTPMSFVGPPTLDLAGAVTGGVKRAIGLNSNAQGAATVATGPASLDIRGPISVMAWVKLPSNVTNQASGRVVSKLMYSGAGGVSYLLALDASTTHMRFLFDLTAGTPSRPTAAIPAPADDAWHFYVGTWDGSTVRIFRDGVVGGTSPTVTGPGQLVSTATKVAVGAPSFSESFRGQVDEVAVWNRALTPAEIASLYAAASG